MYNTHKHFISTDSHFTEKLLCFHGWIDGFEEGICLLARALSDFLHAVGDLLAPCHKLRHHVVCEGIQLCCHALHLVRDEVCVDHGWDELNDCDAAAAELVAQTLRERMQSS